MTLGEWGWGRVILAWLGYWLSLGLLGLVAMWAYVHAEAAQRPPGSDFLIWYSAPDWLPALVLFGPPGALTALWWRRRRLRL